MRRIFVAILLLYPTLRACDNNYRLGFFNIGIAMRVGVAGGEPANSSHIFGHSQTAGEDISISMLAL